MKYKGTCILCYHLSRATNLPKDAFWKYYRDASLTQRDGVGWETLTQSNTSWQLPRVRDDVSEEEVRV